MCRSKDMRLCLVDADSSYGVFMVQWVRSMCVSVGVYVCRYPGMPCARGTVFCCDNLYYGFSFLTF